MGTSRSGIISEVSEESVIKLKADNCALTFASGRASSAYKKHDSFITNLTSLA